TAFSFFGRVIPDKQYIKIFNSYLFLFGLLTVKHFNKIPSGFWSRIFRKACNVYIELLFIGKTKIAYTHGINFMTALTGFMHDKGSGTAFFGFNTVNYKTYFHLVIFIVYYWS